MTPLESRSNYWLSHDVKHDKTDSTLGVMVRTAEKFVQPFLNERCELLRSHLVQGGLSFVFNVLAFQAAFDIGMGFTYVIALLVRYCIQRKCECLRWNGLPRWLGHVALGLFDWGVEQGLIRLWLL